MRRKKNVLKFGATPRRRKALRRYVKKYSGGTMKGARTALHSGIMRGLEHSQRLYKRKGLKAWLLGNPSTKFKIGDRVKIVYSNSMGTVKFIRYNDEGEPVYRVKEDHGPYRYWSEKALERRSNPAKGRGTPARLGAAKGIRAWRSDYKYMADVPKTVFGRALYLRKKALKVKRAYGVNPSSRERMRQELLKIGYSNMDIINYAAKERISVGDAVVKLFRHEQKFLAKQSTLGDPELKLNLEGYKDAGGTFHPIRSSKDYDESIEHAGDLEAERKRDIREASRHMGGRPRSGFYERMYEARMYKRSKSGGGHGRYGGRGGFNRPGKYTDSEVWKAAKSAGYGAWNVAEIVNWYRDTGKLPEKVKKILAGRRNPSAYAWQLKIARSERKLKAAMKAGHLGEARKLKAQIDRATDHAIEAIRKKKVLPKELPLARRRGNPSKAVHIVKWNNHEKKFTREAMAIAFMIRKQREGYRVSHYVRHENPLLTIANKKRSKYSPASRKFISAFMRREMKGRKVGAKKRGQLLAIAMSKVRKRGMKVPPARNPKGHLAKVYDKVISISTDIGKLTPRKKTALYGDTRDRRRLVLFGERFNKELEGAKVYQIDATGNTTKRNDISKGDKFYHPFKVSARITKDKAGHLVIRGSRPLWTDRTY